MKKFTFLGKISKERLRSPFFQTQLESFNIIPFEYMNHLSSYSVNYDYILENISSHVIIASLNSMFEDTYQSLYLMASILSNYKIVILDNECLTLFIVCSKNPEEIITTLFIYNMKGKLIFQKNVVRYKQHFRKSVQEEDQSEMLRDMIIDILVPFFNKERERALTPSEIIFEQVNLLSSSLKEEAPQVNLGE